MFKPLQQSVDKISGMAENKGETFKKALLEAGYTQSSFAREMDSSPQTVRNWTLRGVPTKIAPKVAEKLNVEPDQISELDFSPGKGKMRALLRSVGPSEIEYISVPEVSTKASLGPGNRFSSDQIARNWEIEAALLSQEGIPLDRAILVSCYEDSMEPTLFEGDVVLVHRLEHIPEDGVYAIDTGGGIRIKRVNTLLDGSVEIISDNNRYKTETYHRDNVPELFRVVGKVVRRYWGKIR